MIMMEIFVLGSHVEVVNFAIFFKILKIMSSSIVADLSTDVL
jgi:hypothetical protein